MSDQSNFSGGVFAGLVVGLAAGAGLALLFAPYSGRRTRRLIARKFENAWDTGLDQITETQDQIHEMADKTKKAVSDAIDSAMKKGFSGNNLGS